METVDWFSEMLTSNTTTSNTTTSNTNTNTNTNSKLVYEDVNISIVGNNENKENSNGNDVVIDKDSGNITITFNNFSGKLIIDKTVIGSSSKLSSSSSSRRTSSNWSQHLTVDSTEKSDRKRESPLKIESSSKKALKIKNVSVTPIADTDTSSIIDFNTNANVNGSIERWGHVSATDGENVFIYGGQDSAGTVGDVLMWKVPSTIDEKDGEIVIMRQLCESRPRVWHSMVHLADKKLLLVFGGESQREGCNDDNNEFYDDLLVLDTSLLLWYPPGVSGKGPTARSGHTAGLIYGNKMVIYGGQKNDKYPHNITVLDTERWHWNAYKCDGKPPKARAFHSCCNLSDSCLIFFGGHDASHSFNDIHLLITNDKGTSWKWEQPDTTGTLPHPRAKHAALTIGSATVEHPYGQYLLISGGWNCDGEMGLPPKQTKNTFILDMKSWVWHEISDKCLNDASTLITGIDLMNPSQSPTKLSSLCNVGEVPIRIKVNNKSYISLFGGRLDNGECSSNFVIVDEAMILKAIT